MGAALASSFVWFYWFQKSPVGFTSETKNGITHVVAGSSPVVVSLSILGIFLFIFVMTREVRFETFEASSLKRRFAAFAFDCWYLLLTVVGVSSLLHLLLEAQRSGTFRWRYEIETGASDLADTAIILVNLTVMFMYFAAPLARRRQTVGQWLFRLATVSARRQCSISPILDGSVENIYAVQRPYFPVEIFDGDGRARQDVV